MSHSAIKKMLADWRIAADSLGEPIEMTVSDIPAISLFRDCITDVERALASDSQAAATAEHGLGPATTGEASARPQATEAPASAGSDGLLAPEEGPGWCPFCESADVAPFVTDEFSIRCATCRAYGPAAKSLAEAIRLWNERTAS